MEPLLPVEDPTTGKKASVISSLWPRSGAKRVAPADPSYSPWDEDFAEPVPYRLKANGSQAGAEIQWAGEMAKQHLPAASAEKEHEAGPNPTTQTTLDLAQQGAVLTLRATETLRSTLFYGIKTAGTTAGRTSPTPGCVVDHRRLCCMALPIADGAISACGGSRPRDGCRDAEDQFR